MKLTRHFAAFAVNLALLLLCVMPIMLGLSWFWLNRDSGALRKVTMLPAVIAYSLLVFAIPLAAGCLMHYVLMLAATRLRLTRDRQRVVSVLVSVILATAVLAAAGWQNVTPGVTLVLWFLAAGSFGWFARVANGSSPSEGAMDGDDAQLSRARR